MTTSARSSRPEARVFVALMLGAELGARVMEEVLAVLPERVARWPRAEGLHATLFFAGDVLADERERLENELERVRLVAAPELELTRAGAFPRRGSERVLWIGVAGELGPLHAEVLDAVAAAEVAPDGLERERARTFRPHVTVGRPRARVHEGFYGIELGWSWRPRAVALVESVRAEGPQVYRVLGEWPLA